MQSNEKLKECNFPSDFDNGENHNYNGNSHKDAMPLLKTKENGQCHNESKLGTATITITTTSSSTTTNH